MEKQYPQVAFIVETSKQFGRELLRGVGRYVKAHGPWSVYFTERAQSDFEPEWIGDWKGDGIITRSSSAQLSSKARERGIAVVNVSHFSDIESGLEMPCINCNQSATGRLVAKHFIEQGFHHFGFCHAEGAGWSDERRDAFVSTCENHGHEVSILKLPFSLTERDGDWERDLSSISDWVASLPKPCAVMASYDLFGARIIDACRRTGIRVPEEIAVVGVDNDPLFGTLSWPQLSSVDQNVEEVDFKAASLLAAIMSGKSPSRQTDPVLIPPKELIVRTSSDIHAFGDPQIAAALQFIRDRSNQPLCVDDVAREAALSRRELERRFRQHLGTSPYKEIQRVRIQRIKTILTHTNDTLEFIAADLGFSESSNMASLFKRVTGMSPGQFRKLQKKENSAV